jgi:hypothetical protein
VWSYWWRSVPSASLFEEKGRANVESGLKTYSWRHVLTVGRSDSRSHRHIGVHLAFPQSMKSQAHGFTSVDPNAQVWNKAVNKKGKKNETTVFCTLHIQLCKMNQPINTSSTLPCTQRAGRAYVSGPII